LLCKITQKKYRGKICAIGLDNDFFGLLVKNSGNKNKPNKREFMKLKHLCTAKKQSIK
jgi:hypothetical protein